MGDIMRGFSFFILITLLVLLGGYILYPKNSDTKRKDVELKVTESVVQTNNEVNPDVNNPEIVEQVVLTENGLIQQIQTLIKEIRNSSMGNYENLKKEYFNYNFGSFDWDVGAINGDQFFIELKNVDKVQCNKLINAIIEAITVKVNSSVKKDCDNLNNIQFIFN